MRFQKLALEGAWIIEPDRREDERGFFARTVCRDEFAVHGLSVDFAQCSISYNARRGTVRGLHYQAPPYEEVKLVRCTAGAIYDVIVDLRQSSPTYRRWAALELSAENRIALYIPKGLAHGFQTLADATEVLYQISEPYHPESARGVRWDDPAFGIEWPQAERILSGRDRNYPNFRP